MQVTVNGIGTKYYGENNTQVRNGFCKACGKYATLASYDTTLWFVVLFIPVIPLGKKRILDSCSSCRRHYVVSLAEYQKARAADYAKANELLSHTGDEDSMLRGVALLAGYRNPADVQAAVGSVEAAFPASAKTHGVVGEIHRLMSRFDLAEASLRKSLELEENPDVREAVSEFQFARGALDEGRATLEPILSQPGARAPRAIAMAASAYQSHGRHEDALALLARVTLDDANPELQKSLSKMRSQSEHHLQRSLVEPEKYVIDAERGVVMRKPIRFKTAKIAAGIALVIGASYSAVCFWLGQSQAVYVVNGSERSYNVTVGKQTLTLAPGRIEKIRVPQGTINYAISDKLYLGSPGSVNYTSSFLLRPFNKDAVVINPDGQARILHTREYYAAAPSQPPQPTILHEFVGQTDCIVKDVQYPFETPPSTMQLDSRSSTASVTVLRTDHVTSKYNLLTHYLDEKSSLGDALASRLRDWAIDGSLSTSAAVALLPPETRVEHVQKQLSIRPVLVHAHRQYQEMMERVNPNVDLVAEYKALLSAEPENPTLMYLLARITHDPSASKELLAKAETASPPEPMAFVADAYRCAAAGQYDAALQALTRVKDDPATRDIVVSPMLEVQIALRHWDEALELIPRLPETNRFATILRRTEVQALAGRKIETEDEFKALENQVKNRDAEQAKELRALYEAVRAYINEDEVKYAIWLRESENPSSRFAGAISSANITQAAKLMQEEELEQPHAAMQLYIAATISGDESVRSSALETLIDALRAGDSDQRELATYFDGTHKPSRQELLEFSATPDDKALAFTALGCRWPALRSDAFGLSYLYDYGLQYPHCLLKRARKSANG